MTKHKWLSTTTETIFTNSQLNRTTKQANNIFTTEPSAIIIPIISWIFGFPLLTLLVICYLRRRAKLARERAQHNHSDFDSRANNRSSTRGDIFSELPTNQSVENPFEWI